MSNFTHTGIELNSLSIFHQSQPSMESKYGAYVILKIRIHLLDSYTLENRVSVVRKMLVRELSKTSWHRTKDPVETLQWKTREELSTVFGFHEKVAMCSYLPKNDKDYADAPYSIKEHKEKIRTVIDKIELQICENVMKMSSKDYGSANVAVEVVCMILFFIINGKPSAID